jgi:hypothetical protein
MPTPEDRSEPLPPGLYEQVVDRGIERRAAALSDGSHEVEVDVE